MGNCISSTPADEKDIGKEALAAVKLLMEKTKAQTPATQEGKQAQKDLDQEFDSLAVILKNHAREGRGGPEHKGYHMLGVQSVETSGYIKLLSVPKPPYREYDGGWLRFQYPDNGHWLVTQDPKSGSTQLATATKIVGAMITLNMAPMRSEVDSAGYCKMFRDRIQQTFKNEVTTIGSSIVKGFAMSENQPIQMDGMNWFAWYQQSTVFKPDRRGALSDVKQKQLEVHGMRNEPKGNPPSRKTHCYGFNVTVVAATEVMFDHLEPLFREILSSVRYADADKCEQLLGRFWDASGR